MNLAITPTAGLHGPAPAPGEPQPLLEAEAAFYQEYAWCLDPFPTVRETVVYLRREIDRLGHHTGGWQCGEAATNVYLLSCAVLNALDEYLRGRTFRVPKSLSAVPLSGLLRGVTERLQALRRWRRRARARRWRASWRTGLDAFLRTFVAQPAADARTLAESAQALAALLHSPLPPDLAAEHIYFPSAFRRLDLTHVDVLALGRRLMGRFPDRLRPILLLGLRTAGTYFAPLLRAFLEAEGYCSVVYLTVHPDKGPGAEESAELAHGARRGHLAVILDDPPHSGDTIVRAVDLLGKAGFPTDRVAALVPAHPARPDWGKELALTGTTLLSLEPQQWHKHRLLEPAGAQLRLTEYFRGQCFSSARVVASAAAEQFNAQLHGSEEDVRRTRLKRVYEVRLERPDGDSETRYVLAKSVGWGWLGYHAFLAGQRLAGFVPPLLGLRDGILYSEWLPQPLSPPLPCVGEGGPGGVRGQWIRTTASYVAARVRSLGLGKNPLASLGRHRHHDGFRLLEKVLGRAYGRFLTAALMRPRLCRELSNQPCPFPTLIDGRMHPSEWVAGPEGLLKTDYEHHGMGKNERNALDPAHDLAEALLHLNLSAEEEDELIRIYIQESGDGEVRSRLFLNKFLAGTWAMAEALKGLFEGHRPQELQRRLIDAMHFLTVHTARWCGERCARPGQASWRSPLVVLDVDGVLDRWIFGYPCTTAAGIEALSLLHAHGFAIALDTARSALEVQEYCRAYGFAGGVAEYGSYAWDAVAGRGRVLVSAEALGQLDRARKALEQVPGVFLDPRYQFSIRAFTCEDRRKTLGGLPIPSPLRAVLTLASEDRACVPLPALTVKQIVSDLGLDRLSVRQTTIDTTVVAREVDKGSGPAALLDWVGHNGADTFAVGDSAPDLPLFRAARRCFAPSQISCARLARLLGCRIARRPFQRGLLEVVRSLVHPDGGRCPSCPGPPGGRELFLDLLRAIDRRRSTALLQALIDPGTYEILLR